MVWDLSELDSCIESLFDGVVRRHDLLVVTTFQV